jgi:3-hydroxymyristoyl/3-hydroxydecanoyl-(acyl carrier protein) dehydratase
MAETPPQTFEVAADHPIFAGHFPGRPIVPGVMLLEWVLAEAARSLQRAPATLRVREAKFFTPLEPGQRAHLTLAMGNSRCGFDIRRDATAIARGVLEWDAGV